MAGKARVAGKRCVGLALTGLLLAAVAVTGVVVGTVPGGHGVLAETLAESPAIHFQLYFVFSAPRDFYLVPVGVTVPDPTGEIGASPNRQVVKALELLIQGPPAGSPLWCSLPKDTRVLGCQIGQGTAEVNFSQEILRCNVGARTESLLLTSIVAAAGQAAGVERVRLLVEGKPLDSLGGHIDVSGPLRVEGALEHVLLEAPVDLPGHWCEGPATALFLAGVVQGYPEGDFRPERPVSRNEFFKMVVLALGWQPLPGEGATFADVPAGHWAHPYVERAVAAGILVPSDYGIRLGGDASITRREVAVALVRARGLEKEAERLRGSDLPYTDTASQPDWARGYLAVAHREGLMVGDPEGTFRPAGSLKRGEAAAAVARLVRLGGPSVYLVFPPEGARTGEGVLALGVARVFEGTVQGRLRAGGKEVASTYTTATQGGPGWGVFSLLLPCPQEPAGDAVLEVFWLSPKDGSEQDLVSRRLGPPH